MKYRQWINPEPPSEVSSGNLTLFIDLIDLILIADCSEECQNDVRQEAEINKGVNYDPLSCVFSIEGESHWNNEADEQEKHKNKHVPDNLSLVVGLNDAGFWLADRIFWVQWQEVFNSAFKQVLSVYFIFFIFKFLGVIFIFEWHAIASFILVLWTALTRTSGG